LEDGGERISGQRFRYPIMMVIISVMKMP